MDVYKIIIARRSIRRFKQKSISFNILKKLVNAARLAPSAANLGPLEYVVVTKNNLMGKVFDCLRWAAYIHPQGIPLPGKQPVAYIAVLVNTQKSKLSNYYGHDAGAAIENMLLTAQSFGIGSCWLGSIDRERLRKILEIPKYCLIDSVVALGYPDEKPKIEVFNGSVKYWKDKRGRLHVPKRRLKDIIHTNRFVCKFKSISIEFNK